VLVVGLYIVTFFLDTGYAEMITQMFPPIPTPGFSPNFTGYDLNSINWYEAHEAMAQSPDEALVQVCGSAEFTL